MVNKWRVFSTHSQAATYLMRYFIDNLMATSKGVKFEFFFAGRVRLSADRRRPWCNLIRRTYAIHQKRLTRPTITGDSAQKPLITNNRLLNSYIYPLFICVINEPLINEMHAAKNRRFSRNVNKCETKKKRQLSTLIHVDGPRKPLAARKKARARGQKKLVENCTWKKRQAKQQQPAGIE